MKYKKIVLFSIVCTLVILLVLCVRLLPKEIDNDYKYGVWYKVYLDEVYDKHGNQYYFLIKKGNSKNLLINFYGGGLSINNEMKKNKGNYYVDNIKFEEFNHLVGISKYLVFNDYTIVNIPYVTGDMHLGNNKEYYGYSNFIKIMNKVKEYVNDIDKVVVSGYSAGAFASSILSSVIFSDYFDVDDKSVIIDSALLFGDWSSILSDEWGAPLDIVSRCKTNNIVLDNIEYLVNNYNVRVSFMSTLRDKTLIKYQNYFDNGVFNADDKLISKFTSDLESTVNKVLELPNTSVYLLDEDEEYTRHTLTRFSLENSDIIKYVSDFVNGNIYNYGVE